MKHSRQNNSLWRLRLKQALFVPGCVLVGMLPLAAQAEIKPVPLKTIEKKAKAPAPKKSMKSRKPDASAPVLLEADTFGYDTKNAIVTAEGHAEVVQDNYIVMADRITYNQKTGIVTAEGNVAVSEPSGNVYFAESAELQDALKTGVIHHFRARLADDSTFAAEEARRISETVTEMDYAVYSACKICTDENGNGGAPFWQLKAKHIRYDEEEQRIKYKHARMEMFGVPVLYTPYFSHAAPGADRKSGFLMPKYSLGGNLGATAHLPYYLNLAPQMDATITPILTSDEGQVLSGEFRHLLHSGYYELGGSFTQVDRINDAGVGIGGKEWRGHMEGNGRFRLTDFWRWGFEGKRTSDDTYLRRYEFGDEDSLTSKVYTQGFKDRTYANMEVVSFQGLRARDISSEIPVIHPLVDVSHETRSGWHGSRFGAEGNLMALSREVGTQSRRVSTTAYWRVPHVTHNGHIFEMRTQLRTDLYSVDDMELNNGTPEEYKGTTGRVVPELWFDWRYPLMRRFQSSSLIIEPTVNAVIGANGLESEKIPNEDSLALEFSDSNLFNSQHAPGYDLVESGTRISYGIRGQWDYDGGGNVLFLLGQNYHTDDNNLFPYSSDLSQELSDYVGRIAWNYSDAVQLAYRFRMDRETTELNRNEIESRFRWRPLMLSLNYLRLQSDPYLEDSEELRAVTALDLNEQWTWITNTRRDLTDDGGMILAGTGLQFHNECITVNTSIYRHYITDREIEPSTSVKLEVFFKNLN